jgi:hypothetical protein
MDQSPRLRLRPSRRYFYTNAACFGSLALCSLTLALTIDRFAQLEYRAERTGFTWGLLCAAALSLISGGYVLAAAPSRYYLELTPDGSSERQLVFRRTRRWSDIEGFRAGYDDGPYVAFRYSDQYRFGLPSRWARSRLSASGHLFGSYGQAADDLAQLLNEWRGRYDRVGGDA